MARPVAIVVFLQAAERKSTKLILESSVTKPPSMTRFCICPIFKSSRLTTENRICMEVCRHSQPNRLLEISWKMTMQGIKAAIPMLRAARILTRASRLRPYLVLRRISSAPVWYSQQKSGAVIITQRNMSRKRQSPSYSAALVP